MAGRGAATYLKRQKEQKRMAKAQAKRAARLARRENRAAGISDEMDVLEIAPDTDESETPTTEGPVAE